MDQRRVNKMIERCEVADEPGKIGGEWASEALRAEQDAALEPVRDKVQRHRDSVAEFRAQQDAEADSPEPVACLGTPEPKFEHDSPFGSGEAFYGADEAAPGGATVSEAGNMAVFGTGATRNRKENELRYDGFLSPLALQMFARYMHKNRKTADGTVRAPDNWQKGMPDASYLDSLLRHVMDIWLIYRGYPEAAREGKFEALSGAFFNIQGLMHNWMTEDVTLEEVIATLAATGTLEVPDGDA